MTLEQVKQQVAGTANPLARLGQLSVEKAKLHRLGVEADYFPKFNAALENQFHWFILDYGVLLRADSSVFARPTYQGALTVKIRSLPRASSTHSKSRAR